MDLRWPNVHLASYAIAGVGGLIDGYNEFRELKATERVHHRTENKVLGDFGGGLEFRFTAHLGLFPETTYNVVDGPRNNFLQVNWGSRYAF
jgi:hypothetical protein